MVEAAKNGLTYEALLEYPEDVKVELEHGVLVFQPLPIFEHSYIQRGMSHFVGGPFDNGDGYGGPGGWWIVTEMDIQFDAFNVRRPDLAGWRRERLPSLWKQRPITVIPDWVCEILSPSTANQDRKHKSALYATHGVKHY